MAGLPEGTVTLLFTDIEGSTLLLRKLGDRYGETLETHRALLRSAFEAGGGHEIDTQGDSFFIAFATVRDALEAAVEAQRTLAGERWPRDAEVRVRVGIHTGEPALGDEGYLGLDVHRAARICSAAHGAQILLSQSTRELAADVLPAGTQLEDLGEHQLKDLPRPERLFQLIVPGLPSAFPPLKSLDRQEASASPFLGHERELAPRVARAVFDKTRRLSKRVRSPQPGFAQLAWELRGLAAQAPRELQPEIGVLGGQLFTLGRTAADFERYVGSVDRKLLESKLRESKEMATISRRAGDEADALSEHVARFDSLVSRRAGLATLGAETETALGRIRRNLDSPDVVRADVDALSMQVERLEGAVRTELEQVRSALGDLGVALKRTRHRGVYRSAHRYVVPFYNEVGTEERRQFSSVDEATEFRSALRLAADGQLKAESDWTTVGRTFRATDALPPEGPSYVPPTDEGRPRR